LVSIDLLQLLEERAKNEYLFMPNLDQQIKVEDEEVDIGKNNIVLSLLDAKYNKQWFHQDTVSFKEAVQEISNNPSLGELIEEDGDLVVKLKVTAPPTEQEFLQIQQKLGFKPRPRV
jgi:hypothetical protein